MSTTRVPIPPSGAASTGPFASFAGQQPYPQYLMTGASLAAIAGAIKAARPYGVDQIVVAPGQRQGWTPTVAGNAILITMLLPAVQLLRSPAASNSPDVQSLGACLKLGGKAGVLGNDSLALVFSPIVWFSVSPSAALPSPFAAFNGQSYYPQNLIAPQGQADDLSRVAAAVLTAKPGGVSQIIIVPSMRLGWTFVPVPNAILIGLLVPAIQAVRSPAGWSSPGIVAAKQCLAGGGKLGVLPSDNYMLSFATITWIS